MLERPLHVTRLDSTDTGIARGVFQTLLTLIQNQMGPVIDDLAQFALTIPGWWLIGNNSKVVSFHAEVGYPPIGDFISPDNKEFLKRWIRPGPIHLNFRLCDQGGVHEVKHIQFSVFVRQDLTKVFRHWWDVYYDHPLYDKANHILGSGVKIVAHPKDKSFWFPGRRR